MLNDIENEISIIRKIKVGLLGQFVENVSAISLVFLVIEKLQEIKSEVEASINTLKEEQRLR